MANIVVTSGYPTVGNPTIVTPEPYPGEKYKKTYKIIGVSYCYQKPCMTMYWLLFFYYEHLKP